MGGQLDFWHHHCNALALHHLTPCVSHRHGTNGPVWRSCDRVLEVHIVLFRCDIKAPMPHAL